MRRRNPIRGLTFVILLIMVLSPASLGVRRAHAIVVGGPTPSWVVPGEYLEYNQTYIIDGLTASISVKETLLTAIGGGWRIQSFDPHISAGFAMPDLVTPHDSANQGSAMACRTVSGPSSSSSTQCTTIQSGVADPTAFVGEGELTYTKATVVSLHLGGPGSPAVQAWKVNGTALNVWIYGMLGSGIVNASYFWFDKDLSVKIRDSTNYTNPVYHHYIISVDKLEDTNIPQLRSALSSQESSNSLTQSLTGISSSLPTTSAAARSTDNSLEPPVLFAVAIFAITATLSFFVKGKRHRASVDGESRPSNQSLPQGKSWN